MSIILNEHEEQALRRALENYLPELRYELARVKRERDRHELVELEATLESLRRRLAA